MRVKPSCFKKPTTMNKYTVCLGDERYETHAHSGFAAVSKTAYRFAGKHGENHVNKVWMDIDDGSLPCEVYNEQGELIYWAKGFKE